MTWLTAEPHHQNDNDHQQEVPCLRELYPSSEARHSGTLQVDGAHTLFYQVYGNHNNQHKNKTALFLHGGPGAGGSPNHARFFGESIYGTVVVLDQRGCGRSTPRAEVHCNQTLEHLIQDCEALRHHLLQDNQPWDVVLGGSWGVTLALAYAQAYPESVRSLVLRGVCLMRPCEVDWLFTPQGGAARANPGEWQVFAETVGCNGTMEELDQPDRTILHTYYDQLFGTNATERWNAARGWMRWEISVSSSSSSKSRFEPQPQQNHSNATTGPPRSPAVLIGGPRTSRWSYQDSNGRELDSLEIQSLGLGPDANQAHSGLRRGLGSYDAPYNVALAGIRPVGMNSSLFERARLEETVQFGNATYGLPTLPMLTCFYSVNGLVGTRHNNVISLLDEERMKRIRHIPCVAVQGGRDGICPPDTALDLKQAYGAQMELRIPLNAGHSMYHPEITHELVKATDRVGVQS